LVQIAQGGDKDAARVAAASALLDRGYGKPPQHVEDDIRQHYVILPTQPTNEEWEQRYCGSELPATFVPTSPVASSKLKLEKPLIGASDIGVMSLILRGSNIVGS
jgi:hypothetical protein